MDYVAVTTIVAYLGGVTAVGALMARRTRGSADWAVAGGSDEELKKLYRDNARKFYQI